MTNKSNSRKRQLKSRAQQAGMGIVDAIIWLIIFGVIVAAILGMRNIVWPRAQGWLEASAISTSMNQINSVFSGSPNFAGLDTAAVSSATFFSPKYLPNTGGITNRWGGLVTIGVTTINSTNDTQTYNTTGIPSGACSGIANQIVDDADRITVAGTVVKNPGGVIVPATLTTQCNSAAAVTMLFEKILQH